MMILFVLRADELAENHQELIEVMEENSGKGDRKLDAIADRIVQAVQQVVDALTPAKPALLARAPLAPVAHVRFAASSEEDELRANDTAAA